VCVCVCVCVCVYDGVGREREHLWFVWAGTMGRGSKRKKVEKGRIESSCEMRGRESRF